MDLVWDTDGTGYLVTEDGLMGLASPQVYNLFYRVINSNQGNSPFVKGARPDTFNLAEVGIMRASLRLLTLSAKTQVAIDVVKLNSALGDALGRQFDVTADIDTDELAAAFAVAVPRITKAILDSVADRASA